MQHLIFIFIFKLFFSSIESFYNLIRYEIRFETMIKNIKLKDKELKRKTRKKNRRSIVNLKFAIIFIFISKFILVIFQSLN